MKKGIYALYAVLYNCTSQALFFLAQIVYPFYIYDAADTEGITQQANNRSCIFQAKFCSFKTCNNIWRVKVRPIEKLMA